jgi:hypothetical protein
MRRNVARLPRRPTALTVKGWHVASASENVAVKRPACVARTAFANVLPLTVVRTVTRSRRANPRPATEIGLSSSSATTGRLFVSLAGAVAADTDIADITPKTATTEPNIENLTIAAIGVTLPGSCGLVRFGRHDNGLPIEGVEVAPLTLGGRGRDTCRRDDFGA